MITSALALFAAMSIHSYVDTHDPDNAMMLSRPTYPAPKYMDVADDYEQFTDWVQCDIPQHKIEFLDGMRRVIANVNEMQKYHEPDERIQAYVNADVTNGLRALNCQLKKSQSP